jgi:hypothetical protein
MLAAVALALTTAISVPVMAHENPQDFPMPAAVFQKHVEARLEHAKARMESRIVDLPEAQAQAVREHFATVAASVEAEVHKAVADGTVTLDEARAVRAVARQLHGHHGPRAGEDA